MCILHHYCPTTSPLSHVCLVALPILLIAFLYYLHIPLYSFLLSFFLHSPDDYFIHFHICCYNFLSFILSYVYDSAVVIFPYFWCSPRLHSSLSCDLFHVFSVVMCIFHVSDSSVYFIPRIYLFCNNFPKYPMPFSFSYVSIAALYFPLSLTLLPSSYSVIIMCLHCWFINIS